MNDPVSLVLVFYHRVFFERRSAPAPKSQIRRSDVVQTTRAKHARAHGGGGHMDVEQSLPCVVVILSSNLRGIGHVTQVKDQRLRASISLFVRGESALAEVAEGAM